MDPSRPPAPLNSSSGYFPSFCHPSHLRDTGGRKRGLWTCALTGPWSSDNSESVTSAQQTGCPALTQTSTLLMTVAVLGPVLPLQPSPSKEWALGSLPAPDQHHLTYILSWGEAGGQGLTIKSRCYAFPPPGLLKHLCDHVPSVIVLSCPGKGRGTPGQGQEPVKCQMTSALPRPVSTRL